MKNSLPLLAIAKRILNARSAMLFAVAVALLAGPFRASAAIKWVQDDDTGLYYFMGGSNDTCTVRWVSLEKVTAYYSSTYGPYSGYMMSTQLIKYIVMNHPDLIRYVGTDSGRDWTSNAINPGFDTDSTLNSGSTGYAKSGYTFAISEGGLNSIKEINWDGHVHSSDATKKYHYVTGNIGGIEYFRNLEILSFDNEALYAQETTGKGWTLAEELTSVDLSKNTNLKVVRLGFNNLASIDVSALTGLLDLELSTNFINSIDVSNNTNLVQLDVSQQWDGSGNELKYVTVSSTTDYNDLKVVSFANGLIEDATLQALLNRAPNLLSLDVRSNNLTDVDLSVVPKLQHLFLMKSAYGSRQTYKGAWCHTLDLSALTDLRSLYINNMHLNSLKIYSPNYGKQYMSEVTFALDDNGEVTQTEVYANANNMYDNNFRTLNADLATWTKVSGGVTTYHYLYYLRLTQTDPDLDGGELLENKYGRYDRHYLTADSTQHADTLYLADINATLASDGFELGRVTAWYPITKDSVISNSYDVYGFIVDTEQLQTTDISGDVIVLAQGESESELTQKPSGLPAGIAYDYNTLADGVDLSENTENEGRYTMRFNLQLKYPEISVPTAVTPVLGEREVAGVTYVNAAGIQSTTPFDGFNIVVTRYTDGTRSATRIIR